MAMKQLVMIAFQLSIMSTVFCFGLKASTDDLLYVVRRPWLFVRSLLSVTVVMPLVVIACLYAVDLRPTVQIALIALAISPLPPLLPKKETGAGGLQSYGFGLMMLLALLSIVLVPLYVELLAAWFDRPLDMPASAVAGVVLKSVLVPFVAGMLIRSFASGVAARIEKPLSMLAKALLALGVLALLIYAAPGLWELVGDLTIVAIIVFTLAGLAIGYVFGRPQQDHAIVLALATACRHPAIALTIAATNFPEQRFGATILLYLIVSAVVTGLWILWLRRAQRTIEAPVRP